MLRRFAAIFVLSLLVLHSAPTTVQAAESQPTPAPTGITVTPAITQIDLSKANSQPTFTISIRNSLSDTQTFEASSLNIAGLDVNNDVLFLPAGTPNVRGLSNNLNYSPASFELGPGQARSVQVTITGVDDLAPGGHYGAAVFTSRPSGSSASDTPVALRQAVSSLIFLTTRTGGVKTVDLTDITSPRFGWKLPESVDLFFSNTGNTQLAPIGYVSVGRGTDIAGRGIINPDRNLVLPEQNRVYRTSLNQNTGWRLAGRYTITVSYQADPDAAIQTKSQTFWYITPWLLVAFAAFWIVLFGSIVGLRKFYKHRRKS